MFTCISYDFHISCHIIFTFISHCCLNPVFQPMAALLTGMLGMMGGFFKEHFMGGRWAVNEYKELPPIGKATKLMYWPVAAQYRNSNFPKGHADFQQLSQTHRIRRPSILVSQIPVWTQPPSMESAQTRTLHRRPPSALLRVQTSWSSHKPCPTLDAQLQ